MVINNLAPITSTYKGGKKIDSIDELNFLYRNAIQMLRYKQSNWIKGLGINNLTLGANSDKTLASYEPNHFTLFCKTKRLMLIVIKVGESKDIDGNEEIPTMSLNVRLPNYTTNLTTVQTAVSSSFQYYSSDYQNENSTGSVISNGTNVYYSYVVCDFTVDEIVSGNRYTDSDGVPYLNKIYVDVKYDTTKNVTFHDDAYIKFIEVGSGINPTYNVSLNYGEKISENFIRGIGDLLNYKMVDYSYTTQNEHFYNLILGTPLINYTGLDLSWLFTLNDYTADKKIIEMLQKLYESRDLSLDFSNLHLITSNTVDYFNVSPSTRLVLFEDTNYLYNTYPMTGSSINDGTRYFNHGKIHRDHITKNFKQQNDSGEIFQVRQTGLTLNSYNSLLAFQNSFIDSATKSAISTSNETFLLFNYLGNLANSDYRPIDNMFLSIKHG